MYIEQSFFQKATVNFSCLLPYGFTRTAAGYLYSATILNGDFRVDVLITTQGETLGQVFDVVADSEYVNVHISSQQGEFVHTVREAYYNILEDILTNCFIKKYFISAQADRLARSMIETYGEQPCFPWHKYPDFAIFKHQHNAKWFALVMNIDKNKLVKKADNKVDVINLKVDRENIVDLLQEKGIYPAYHMNKKNWVSVILDDSLSDDRILQLIKQSYQLTAATKSDTQRHKTINEWLIPANPKYFDVEQAFRENTEITWKQSTNLTIGDMVYMYVAAPRSAILYQCVVTEINIPYHKKHRYLTIKHLMKIRLLHQFSPDELPLDKLKEFGVKAVRGPRGMPEELKNYIKDSFCVPIRGSGKVYFPQ